MKIWETGGVTELCNSHWHSDENESHNYEWYYLMVAYTSISRDIKTSYRFLLLWLISVYTEKQGA